MTTETRRTAPADRGAHPTSAGGQPPGYPPSPGAGQTPRGQADNGLSATADSYPPRIVPAPLADSPRTAARGQSTDSRPADSTPRTAPATDKSPRPTDSTKPSADSADRPWWKRAKPAKPAQSVKPSADETADNGPGWLERRREKKAKRRAEETDMRARRALVAEQAGGHGALGGWWVAMWSFGTTTAISALAALFFSMGNVSETAMAAGLPYAISMAISPTTDAVVIGLTVTVQYLVMAGSTAKYIRAAKAALIFSAAVMLLINCLPSVIGALTTEYAGPIMKASKDFTPAQDQLTASQLWWKATLEAIVPGILVMWSHVGPKIAEAFAEIRDRANRAALAKVDLRTMATERDRAAAEQDRAAAAAAREAAEHSAAKLREAAEEAAAELRRIAVRDADEIRAAASHKAAEMLHLVDGDAETIRQRVSAELSADKQQAVRELAEARRIRAEAEIAAADAARQAENARREAQHLLDAARRNASRTAESAGVEADLLSVRARAELAEARRLVEQAAADKAAADKARQESADNLRAAEELVAEMTGGSPAVRGQRGGQAGGQPGNPAGLHGVPTIGGRKSGDELKAERVAAVKQARPDWATHPPTQSEIAQIIGASGGSATSPVRKQLAEDAIALQAAADGVPA